MCVKYRTSQLWTTVQTALKTTQPPKQWVPGLSRGSSVRGRDVHHPPTSSADVKEKVELYLYSLSGPSWPVLGSTLPLPLPFTANYVHQYFGYSNPACSVVIYIYIYIYIVILSLLFHRAFFMYLLTCTNECTILWLKYYTNISLLYNYTCSFFFTCFDPLRVIFRELRKFLIKLFSKFFF